MMAPVQLICLILSILTTATNCLDKQGIQRLKKNFNDSISVLDDRVDCSVVVARENNGCLLQGFTDKCVILPTLKLLQSVLFPYIHLEKASGGFIKNIKLRVEMYSLNVCDETSPFFQISLTSLESYELAERYLIVDQLKFNIRFSTIEGTVNGLADVTISHGEAQTMIGGNNLTIALNSGKGKRVLNYEFAADVLPLEEILKKFHLTSLESTFGKEVVDEKRLSLLQFIDLKAVGYSTPGKAFEFELSGNVNGPDSFSAASKVFLIMQKYTHELKDVKCLLFALLEDQTPLTFYRISRLGEIDSNIPFLNPVDGKIALVISNADFLAFNNEGIKHTVNMFATESNSGNIVSKGSKFIYRLQRVDVDNDNDGNSTSVDSDDATEMLEDSAKSGLKYEPTPTMKTTTKPLTTTWKLKTTKTKHDGYSSSALERQQATYQHKSQSFPQQQQQQQRKQKQYQYNKQSNMAQSYSYPPQQIWYPNQRNYQQRQYLSYPNNGYYNVRSKREPGDSYENEEIIKNIMKNENTSSDKELSFQSETRYLVFEMEVNKDSVLIQPKQDVSGNFADMMAYILGDKYAAGRDEVPIKEESDVYLQSVELFNVDSMMDVKMDLIQSEPLVVAPDFLELKEIGLSVSRSISSNNKWRLAKGTSKNDESDTNIVYNVFTKNYFITGQLEVYAQDELENKTNQAPLPTKYQQIFPELTKFPYNNATFKMELNKNGTGFTVIEAESLMFDTKKVAIESVIWKDEKIEGLTTGIIVKNIDLNDFLFSLYSKRMLKICWLKMKELVIIFSTKQNNSMDGMFLSNVKGIDLSKDDIIVVKGSLDVNLKTGCLDEPVCNFIKNHILHELSLNLEGRILTTSYMFTAALEGVSIPFGDTWGMSQLMLTIAGTSEKDSGITLAGTIIHAETKRIGKFFVGEDKFLKRNTLEIIFETPWRSFLGFPMLTVKGMVSEMDISGDKKLKDLAFTATMEVGNSNTPIVIENAIVVMDMKRAHSAENDVIYGSLKNVSMIQFGKAFKSAKLDQLSRKFAFNHELRVCFTNNEKGFQVEEFGGFKFDPTCNAIGSINTFAGNVTAQFTLNRKLKMRFQSKRLKYNDENLIIQKSEKNIKDGPEFTFQFIDGKNTTTSKTSVKGYMETVGFKGPFKSNLQNSRFSHQFSAYLFDEVKMLVNITGKIDQHMNDTKFTTKLDQVTALPEIKRKLRHIIKKETDFVTNNLIRRMELLEKEILKVINNIQNDEIKLTSEIREKKSNVFKRRFSIEKLNEVIKQDCTESCGKECVTALDWDHDCSTVRNQKFGCLKWKTCQAQASDTRCIAKCEAAKIPATITAHEKRDGIRYLSEEIIQTRKLAGIKDKLIKKGRNLHAEARRKTDYFKDRLYFLTSINPSIKALFSFTTPMTPASSQQLSNMTSPCLYYDAIEYKFLSQTYTVKNKEICMNGNYFRDLAEVILEGFDKGFGQLPEIKDEITKDIINLQNNLNTFKEKYSRQLEREKDEVNGDEDDDDDDEDDDEDDYKEEKEDKTNSGQTKRPSEIPMESSNITGSVFSDAFPLYQASKRSEVTDEDENKEILEATEADIAHYVIKGSKTFAAFETDAPWIYMNKKRGITIPALGMLSLKNSSFDDHCTKRNDAIEHFEDLASSLNDIKLAYEEGKTSLEKERTRLLNDRRDVDDEITNAKNSIQSILERNDMIYWLKSYKDGITEYLESAKKQLEHQNKVSLKYWLTQLDSAVRANIARTSVKYFEKLRLNVVKSNYAAKRSKIAGEEALDSVTKEFITIAQKELSLSELNGRLTKISKQLDVFKRSSLTCAP